MAYQAVFKRYEIKYLLTRQQKQRLLAAMEPYMALDSYGRTTIRNIYFDTENFRLIRRSLEKPVYKEKLRLRSYAREGQTGPVFVELKKKYRDVVYKRRLAMAEEEALDWLCGSGGGDGSQIGEEIEYFRAYYGPLKPAVFLSYEREAYYCRNGTDFRVTFDENILARREHIRMDAGEGGSSLMDGDRVMMEIKTSGGIPLWMTGFLTRERIFKTSFSKYGTAYKNLIFPKLKGEGTYV